MMGMSNGGYLGPGISDQEGVAYLAKTIMTMYDREKKGALEHTEIANVMIDLYRSINKNYTPSKFDIESYTRVMDSNGDGRITQRDFENLIKKYMMVNVEITRKSVMKSSTSVKSKTFDKSKLEKAFKEVDIDGDGSINSYEFEKTIKKNGKDMGIDPYSVNCQNLFNKVDLDNDGKIDLTEFIEAIGRA